MSGKLIFHSQKTSLIEKFLSICITNVFTYITIITGLSTVVKINIIKMIYTFVYTLHIFTIVYMYDRYVVYYMYYCIMQ